MWLGIQVRMMLLFLERVFILSRTLVMREIDELKFCRTWKTDLESEWMIILEDLRLAILSFAVWIHLYRCSGDL